MAAFLCSGGFLIAIRLNSMLPFRPVPSLSISGHETLLQLRNGLRSLFAVAHSFRMNLRKLPPLCFHEILIRILYIYSCSNVRCMRYLKEDLNLPQPPFFYHWLLHELSYSVEASRTYGGWALQDQK
jgi:hypothetical protein